jgi:hypothetical protein
LGSKDYTSGEVVISFSEAPLRELITQSPVLTTEDYTRLSLYGLGFRKQYLYSLGARPVVYQPNADIALLDDSIRWRHVEFDLEKPVDYTWQREWRLKAEKLEFDYEEVVALLEDTADLADLLWEINIDVDVEGSSGEWYYVGGTCKKLDFIPLEHAEISDDASIDVCIAQDFTDTLSEEDYEKLEINGP